MTLAIVLIGIILLFLAVLVILLVDALINDSDAVINAPGAGMDSGVNTGEREHVHTAPLKCQPLERAEWVELPKPVPHVVTQQEAEQRLARMMNDPDLRNIPPMVFAEPMPRRDSVEVLFPRQPRTLFVPPLPEESIVEQIDAVLQENIAGTPLARRDIRLIESPTRGVTVKVGPQSFDGVDAVTDPEVKAAVQAAVAQWEAEQ